MSKDFSFSVMPTVSISRSRFVRKSQHKTSFRHGMIIPIYVDEVLPGDTRSFDMASLVRMSTPIAPIMDNIYMDYFAFFVPNRLVWDHWKDFMGENRESAGIPSSEYAVPYLELDGEDNSGEDLSAGSFATQLDTLADYFGIGGIVHRDTSTGSQAAKVKVSALPFRSYYLCYNEWLRNQNLIAPIAVQTGDDNEAIVGTGSTVNMYSVLYAAKMADYFTKSLPFAQKGQAVSIPLGTTAPVIATNSAYYETIDNQKYIRGGLISTENGTTFDTDGISLDDNGVMSSANQLGPGDSYPAYRQGVLAADLSQATAATINQLRYAFQLQKLLEKDALYGSRYWEILASHFGVTAPDASIQRPEYLGGFRQRINVDQVLSTAGYNASSSTTVGAPGANSVTVSKGSLFTKSFVEHGTLLILAVARHDHTYSAGINRMWSRRNRFDYYFPVFANLGAQSVLKQELCAVVGSSKPANLQNEDLFGYQEAWAEYRYKPSIVSGVLNPNRASSLDFWTLADKYITGGTAQVPTLGATFNNEGRSAISRALVTGNSGPDYIADFYFEDVAVRPMPTYSIPGLIDHH